MIVVMHMMHMFVPDSTKPKKVEKIFKKYCVSLTVSQWEPQGLQVVRKDGCYFYYNSTLISQVRLKKSPVVFEVRGIPNFPDSKN